jgi:hypothetical protein
MLDNGIDKYLIADDSVFLSFPGMDHLYLRLAWAYLEPAEGKFDWSYIDDIVEKYVPSWVMVFLPHYNQGNRPCTLAVCLKKWKG